MRDPKPQSGRKRFSSKKWTKENLFIRIENIKNKSSQLFLKITHWNISRKIRHWFFDLQSKNDIRD